MTKRRSAFGPNAGQSARRNARGSLAGAWQMRPLWRGYVEAKSNRPGNMPAINPLYLSEEADQRASQPIPAARTTDS